MSGGGVAFAAGVMSRGEGGRLASGEGLTDQQRAFVAAWLSNGGHAKAAAETAGYAFPEVEASRLPANPAIWVAMQSGMVRKAGPVALRALDEVQRLIADGAEVSGARVALLRLAMEAGGIVGRSRIQAAADGGKPLGAMSLAEIRAELDGLRERSAGNRGTTGPKVIDVEA